MAIATNDPIKHAVIQGMYDDIRTYVSPPMETGKYVNDDGSLGHSIVVQITSGSFVEISPNLSMTLNGHVVSGYIHPVVVVVPMFVNISVANGTVELGLTVNGTLLASSVQRMTTPAFSNPVNGAFTYTHVIGGIETFGLAGFITGTADLLIKPVGRVVSGGSTLTIRYYSLARSFAKEF